MDNWTNAKDNWTNAKLCDVANLILGRDSVSFSPWIVSGFEAGKNLSERLYRRHCHRGTRYRGAGGLCRLGGMAEPDRWIVDAGFHPGYLGFPG